MAEPWAARPHENRRVTLVWSGFLAPTGSAASLCGQLLARKSFPSKLPFCFWAPVAAGGNIRGRMGSFAPAFDDLGMTCKWTDLALGCSAMLMHSWPLFSKPPGAIMWAGTMHDSDLQHHSLCRETCFCGPPPGRSGALTLSILSGFAQPQLGQLKHCEPEQPVVTCLGVV